MGNIVQAELMSGCWYCRARGNLGTPIKVTHPGGLIGRLEDKAPKKRHFNRDLAQ